MANTLRDRLFVCHSHEDRRSLEQIRVFLKPLERELPITVWDDSVIRPGVRWFTEILDALSASRVALLLVSPDFLASEFVINEELPRLLRAAENDGVIVLSLILRPCRFSKFAAISQFQSINSPDRPLYSLTRYQREQTLVSLVDEVEEIFCQYV